MAIIEFELANIILDPLYVRPVEPRRLVVRNTKRGRPKHFSGEAVEFLQLIFLYILILCKLILYDNKHFFYFILYFFTNCVLCKLVACINYKIGLEKQYFS
jgi:hypothetical protein